MASRAYFHPRDLKAGPKQRCAVSDGSEEKRKALQSLQTFSPRPLHVSKNLETRTKFSPPAT